MSSLDPYRGVLIGQALGDALGFPVEGCDSATCAAYTTEFLDDPEAALPPGRGSYPFGQYTDDTQLARELLQSYLARGLFDPGDYAARIAAIFAEDRIVGWGRATRDAAERLMAGVPWDRAGTPAPSAGNGSAMRAGAVALLCTTPGHALRRAALDQGRITHRDPRCGAGAVAIATAVRLALTHDPIEPTRFVDTLVEAVRPVHGEFADCLTRLPNLLALSPADATEAVARLGLPPDAHPDWPGISPFVIPSVVWSLYAFLASPDRYTQAIRTAISSGGDVDTTAAMTGAIVGGHVGLSGIPVAWAQHLTDRGTWGMRELIDLADRIHARVVGGSGEHGCEHIT